MAEAYVFLADGFEEVEALTPVDLLRRAGVEVATISVNGSNIVTGAHGVPVVADEIFEEASGLADALMLVCPGGMPGASNLAAHPGLCDLLAKQHAAHRYVAAICAAPAVTLAPLGILNGLEATCYPGFESGLKEGGATPKGQRVVKADKVITANGPSSAIPFALALVEALKGPQTAADVAAGILL